MLRFATILAVLTAVLVAGLVGAQDKPAPVVDVVLCLDVSSSMNELIGSTKAKLDRKRVV